MCAYFWHIPSDLKANITLPTSVWCPITRCHRTPNGLNNKQNLYLKFIIFILFLKHMYIYHPGLMQKGDILFYIPSNKCIYSKMSIHPILCSKLYASKVLIFLSVQFHQIGKYLNQEIKRYKCTKKDKTWIWDEQKIRRKKGSLNLEELKDTVFMNRSTWLHSAQLLHILSYQKREKTLEN